MPGPERALVAFLNPFRPGAGHMPPYLAGRVAERREFERLLEKKPVLQNLVLTGLRGVGKTVLLETFKPIAVEQGWLWVGTDLSEAASVSEANLALRLITDLSVVTSSVTVLIGNAPATGLGGQPQEVRQNLDFAFLMSVYEGTPGLPSDKLKAVLELIWPVMEQRNKRGIVFAYDEAQNLSDHAGKEQYPLSLLLDVFQSVQRKGFPYLLVLTGLPTLLPKLVEARTYAERMFHTVFLDRLSEDDARAAIIKPVQDERSQLKFSDRSVQSIYKMTRGYPYFIQYVCREVFDVWVQNTRTGKPAPAIPVDEITRKLDADFFAGRWARATDRQRDLLGVIASLESRSEEFTVQEIVARAAETLSRPFTGSHVSQMLSDLNAAGLIYKNRWGKYSFAVPLLDEFIRRQQEFMRQQGLAR
jgi:hypothetical protein